ncbi:MAG: hypothetical protein QE271_05995 [Bacteriovoracaceae bacterium]|nr:hypothetical protein [Bacteriovoracaceae bacterium]
MILKLCLNKLFFFICALYSSLAICAVDDSNIKNLAERSQLGKNVKLDQGSIAVLDQYARSIGPNKDKRFIVIMSCSQKIEKRSKTATNCEFAKTKGLINPQ